MTGTPYARYAVDELALENAKKEAHALAQLLKNYADTYYNTGYPDIPDEEYDRLFNRLKAIEEKFPHLGNADSPTQRIGAKVSSTQRGKIKHDVPMLSLNNVFDEAGLDAFILRTKKYFSLSPEDEMAFTGEAKIDGLSLNLRYEDGRLRHAALRGDGFIGENVSDKIPYINDIPERLADYKNTLDVRGEIYMTFSDFETLRTEQLEKAMPAFSNPRNAASGALRLDNAEEIRQRPLRFFAYGTGLAPSLPVKTRWELLAFFKKQGLPVCPYTKLCPDFISATRFYQSLAMLRKDIDYPIDGIVYKVNDFRLFFSPPDYSRRRAPVDSIAYKLPTQSITTRIEDIVLQIGPTGMVTPVAVLSPVTIEGARVTRVSLHNLDEIREKDIRIGDNALVTRSGGVIPYILATDKTRRAKESKVFSMPSVCFSCQAPLQRRETSRIRNPARQSSYEGTHAVVLCTSGRHFSIKCWELVLDKVSATIKATADLPIDALKDTSCRLFLYKDKKEKERWEFACHTLSIQNKKASFLCKAEHTIHTDTGLFCPNRAQCYDQRTAQLKRLCQRTALDIEALGEKTLRYLYKHGYIRAPADIFLLKSLDRRLKELVQPLSSKPIKQLSTSNNLNRQAVMKEIWHCLLDRYCIPLSQRPGFGERSVEKILQSIERSRHTTAERVYYGLCIPSVGEEKARILAGIIPSPEQLVKLATQPREDTERNETLPNKLSGALGQECVRNICAHFADPFLRAEAEALFSQLVMRQTTQQQTSILAGKQFVFTGTLEGMTRNKARDLLKSLGAHVAGQIGKSTDYLVVGTSKGSPGKKMQTAEKAGVTQINEAQWQELVKQASSQASKAATKPVNPG